MEIVGELDERVIVLTGEVVAVVKLQAYAVPTDLGLVKVSLSVKVRLYPVLLGKLLVTLMVNEVKLLLVTFDVQFPVQVDPELV